MRGLNECLAQDSHTINAHSFLDEVMQAQKVSAKNMPCRNSSKVLQKVVQTLQGCKTDMLTHLAVKVLQRVI